MNLKKVFNDSLLTSGGRKRSWVEIQSYLCECLIGGPIVNIKRSCS